MEIKVMQRNLLFMKIVLYLVDVFQMNTHPVHICGFYILVLAWISRLCQKLIHVSQSSVILYFHNCKIYLMYVRHSCVFYMSLSPRWTYWDLLVINFNMVSISLCLICFAFQYGLTVLINSLPFFHLVSHNDFTVAL